MTAQPRRDDGTPQGRVFGEVAESYDRVRPSYPGELFALLGRRAGLGVGARVLEVGAGTGKATVALVERGWDVTAVEPDPAMAEVLRERAAGARVVASPFEDADLDGRFDLVCAAQSWHWLDPERGFARAASLLGEGGTLAMWWNLPAGTEPALREALDAVYAQVAAGMEHGPWHRPRFGLTEDGAAPAWPAPFGPVEEVDLPWETTYSADEWITLLSTQSDHRMLAPAVRDRLLDGVRVAVEAHGGEVPLPYVCRVHLAERS